MIHKWVGQLVKYKDGTMYDDVILESDRVEVSLSDCDRRSVFLEGYWETFELIYQKECIDHQHRSVSSTRFESGLSN